MWIWWMFLELKKKIVICTLKKKKKVNTAKHKCLGDL